ncbi:hypothetical protein [Mesorhizobium onobrychidis]|uniref:Cytochrome c domain-containing protein n=1 Tax=Mesorhizobium onobrychidis TaxID=2775404 RepID=A0ABY5R1D6_9HYPH|nr:hypothetical protein [Mesorhizobium onobrychidis]UVC17280.1 hypothetical protein IHQ72_09245 [Mesorhizobium onobrychidis]
MSDQILRKGWKSKMRVPALPVVLALSLWLTCMDGKVAAETNQATGYVSSELVGPFVADPRVVSELDCPSPSEVDSSCDGPLNFETLIRGQFKSLQTKDRPGSNPFHAPEAALIVSTIESDLQELGIEAGATGFQISKDVLTDPGSRIELVGVINRMDRQFLRDHTESICGEISAIYRFSYSIRKGRAESRLPITMNIVFPASAGNVTCQMAAKRWLAAIAHSPNRTPEEIAKDLVDPASGALSTLVGGRIARLELNMQVYRKPAFYAEDFGSEAAYVIRVFRWNAASSRFEPTELPNQVDRNSLLCAPSDSEAICRTKRSNRAQLIAYLQQPYTVSEVDKGLLNVPSSLGILSRRAVSISPGGSHRSANQPYWNSIRDDQQVISDAEISNAIDRAKSAGIPLSYIRNVEDFRSRLNDSTCTGCHQTRAIAGFHFPGADRLDTPRSNAVLLAGSPHFYGDQPRRLEIVRRIAQSKDGRIPADELATGYSARPEARFSQEFKSTAFIGGWGGTCLMPEARSKSARDWGCKPGLKCEQVFWSENDPGVGTCVPDGRQEIGDALQRGDITTAAFGLDVYQRTMPEPVKDGDTRIPASALPANPPPENSYYGHHQEYYEGQAPAEAEPCESTPPDPKCYDIRRDHRTGGFPSGALSLSECIGLPQEATCGLTASSGFNACLARIAEDQSYDVKLCFDYFTSYSGIRACDIANPCRDDYICTRPMKYTHYDFIKRWFKLTFFPYFREVLDRPYDPHDYGQKRPDNNWVARNDQRGICIPPYFVFQFRSDRHPTPEEK